MWDPPVDFCETRVVKIIRASDDDHKFSTLVPLRAFDLGRVRSSLGSDISSKEGCRDILVGCPGIVARYFRMSPITDDCSARKLQFAVCTFKRSLDSVCCRQSFVSERSCSAGGRAVYDSPMQFAVCRTSSYRLSLVQSEFSARSPVRIPCQDPVRRSPVEIPRGDPLARSPAEPAAQTQNRT